MNVIPKVKKIEHQAGTCRIDVTSTLAFSEEFSVAAQLLQALLQGALGTEIVVAEEGTIRLLQVDGMGAEAYSLGITEQGICIKATTPKGALYGVQSLRQAMELDLLENAEVIQVPCVKIEDEPRFGWRGFHLDEARHFFGMVEVKRLLELMSLHKLNVFHWHLSDDQGWRIEIKQYPLLTEIGSKRADSAIGGWNQCIKEGKPHGGFYTQEEIKEIVAFAAQRGIMVVPEIDMPAHFMAAFASYPWLACREIQIEVPWFFAGRTPAMAGIKDWNRSACIGKDTTFEFVFAVLGELFPLFPGEYIHIGGDEAPKGEWKKCPLCQKRMKDNNLANEEELQGYFNNRINEYVHKHGKKLITWNEALKAKGLDDTVVAEYWTPQADRNVNAFLKRGGKIIYCKHQSFYFDMCYGQYPLRYTFHFERKGKKLFAAYPNQILGVEGHLWTEWVSEREKLDVSLFPRMEALAESGWSDGKNKNYPEFLERLHQFEKILDALGVTYAVDEVADPKNPIKRLYEMRMWMNKDQHRDVKKNRELRKNRE